MYINICLYKHTRTLYIYIFRQNNAFSEGTIEVQIDW